MRPEADLIPGLRKKDPGIFEEFLRRFQQRVYFTSLRLLADRDDALDAAQEAFLKMWRFAPRLERGHALNAWVYRVTVNTCLDRLRERARHRKHTTHDNLVTLTVADDGYSPRQRARMAEELQLLKQALERLTERQRAVFVLRHFQSLKLQEIADVLDAPLGTVKSTLHQSLAKLRGILSNTSTGGIRRRAGEEGR